VFFYLKALLRSLILPPAGPMILAVVGALMIWRRRPSGGPVLALGLGSLWLAATPVIADALSRLTVHYPPLNLSKPTNAGAIVILAGGSERQFAPEYGGPMVKGALLERLTYGAFVARRTGLSVLISGSPNEANAMRASLNRDFGINPRWEDNKSQDTFENAKFSARILRAAGVKRIILVTSSEHAWRASQEFQDAGLDVVPAPVGLWVPSELGAKGFVPSPAALLQSHVAVYELLGERVRSVLEILHARQAFYPNSPDP
jgi:uncharacterized SAM-binding protein YcdF (DUF218 family)